METNIFIRLKNLLELHNNRKYQKAVEKFTSENAIPEEKRQYQTVIFSTVVEEFRTNPKIKAYLTENDKALISSLAEKIIVTEDLSDNEFYRALWMLQERASTHIGSYQIDKKIIPALQHAAKELGCTTVINSLAEITQDTDVKTKKKKIVDALQELHFATKTRIATTDKSLYTAQEIKERIKSIDECMSQITSKLESEQNTDYVSLPEEIYTFLDADAFLIREIERLHKLSVQEREEALKAFKDAGRGEGPMEKDSKKNTKLAVLGDNALSKLSLQRQPKSGETDKPIKKPSKVKKIAIMCAAGVLVVGLAVGSYFLGKNNSNSNENTEEEPGFSDNVDVYLAEIEADADIVYNNWCQFEPAEDNQKTYTKEEIIEVIKCLRGLDSSYTISEVDEILLDMLNRAIEPGINNLLIGSQEDRIHELDFASLLSDDQEGIKAVENMEDALNGTLTDQENIHDYATRAFEDQAFLIGEEKTIDGLNVSKNTITDPGVRLVWSRLAIGTNAIAGILGENFSVEVDGNIYTQSDINNSGALENIATEAKKDMGYKSKSIELN